MVSDEMLRPDSVRSMEQASVVLMPASRGTGSGVGDLSRMMIKDGVFESNDLPSIMSGLILRWES